MRGVKKPVVTLHINITKNNSILTLSSLTGNTIMYKNGGSADIPKKSKVTCLYNCNFIIERIKKVGINQINLHFKGSYRK